MMFLDTTKGIAAVDPLRVVGLEQNYEDVVVMLEGGHSIMATDTTVHVMKMAVESEIEDMKENAK